MPYIAYDLDALNKAPEIARATGADEDCIAAGLARMWAACFREKIDILPRLRVAGFFRQDLTEALTVFGFLEAMPEGFRVRGADRYLRIAEARSRGGKAAAANLRRGQVKPEISRGPAGGSAPAPAGDQPEVQPNSSSGSSPALSPSTEHRAPKQLPPPRATNRETTPVLGDRIEAVFREERGADWTWRQGEQDALRGLLAHPEDEVVKRWRNALRRTRYPLCRGLPDLLRDWNVYATEEPLAARDKPKPNRDPPPSVVGEVFNGF